MARAGSKVERLAYHYIQAGNYEHGLTYAKKAAEEAARVFAIDETITAHRRALDCAEALGLIEEQVIQQESIGKVYLLHGELIAAGEHFERALSLTNDPAVRTRLQLEAATSLVATGNQRGIDYVRKALAVLDPVANPLLTARAMSTEARFHHLAGRHLKAIELCERAADLVAPLGCRRLCNHVCGANNYSDLRFPCRRQPTSWTLPRRGSLGSTDLGVRSNAQRVIRTGVWP